MLIRLLLDAIFSLHLKKLLTLVSDLIVKVNKDTIIASCIDQNPDTTMRWYRMARLDQHHHEMYPTEINSEDETKDGKFSLC